MNYFTLLTLVVILTTVIGLTLFASHFKNEMRAKVIICLYLIMAMHWVDTGVVLVKESVTCTFKEKT